MGESVSSYLRRDMECEGLLECFHGLKPLDRDCFRAIVGSDDPLTVDEVAEALERERSTAYRSIQRLLQSGFIEQEQVNYDSGGYYHVYRPADPDVVADEMQRMLNDWYAMMGQLIREFRDKYRTGEDQPPPTTS